MIKWKKSDDVYSMSIGGVIRILTQGPVEGKYKVMINNTMLNPEPDLKSAKRIAIKVAGGVLKQAEKEYQEAKTTL